MTGFSRRTRRLLIGLTLLLSLSATPRPAEAGPREECLAAVGSLCFITAAVCDVSPGVPESFCNRFFLSCARAAVAFCYGLT
jgi:hypothetical protein